MHTSSHLHIIQAVACAVLLGASASAVITYAAGNGAPAAGPQAVEFTQIRNAAIKVEYAGTTFLIDPMLAKKGAYQGFPGTYNSQLRNPLVDLHVPLSQVIKADAVIVTHAQHYDH